MQKTAVKHSAILLCCLMLAVCLCACGNKKKQENTVDTTMLSEVDAKDVTFSGEKLDLTGYSGYLGARTVLNDKIFFASYDQEEEKTKLYCANVTGGTATEIPLPYLNSDDYTDVFLETLCYGDGESALMKLKLTEAGSNKQSEKYFKLNSDGSYEEVDLGISPEDSDAFIINIFYDKNENCIVVFDKMLKVYKDGKEKNTFSPGGDYGYIIGAAFTKDDRLIIAFQNNDGMTVAIYDAETGKIAEQYLLAVSVSNSYQCLFKGTDEYDFYYQTSSGIAGFIISEKKAVKLLDYTASGVNTENTVVAVLSPSEMLFTDYDKEIESYVFSIYKKIDPSEIDERITLTLACVYKSNDILQDVIDFNKENTEYRIEVRDYSEETDPIMKMSADIAAGNIPDIYDVNQGVGDLSVEQCVAKGMFADLTPYFENDEDIKPEEFMPNVVNALKIDGKYYFTASGFSVYTLLARKSEVDVDGWNMNEFIDYVKSKPDSRLFMNNTKKGMLQNFLYFATEDYVDWINGTTDFESEEFKQLLELCNTGVDGDVGWDENESMIEMMKNGKLLFIDGELTVNSLDMNRELFGEDVSWPGFPCEDRLGNSTELINTLAISSSCEHIDAAWEFAKRQMTRERQAKYYMEGWCMPMWKDLFEMYLKTQTTTEKYTDEFGNEIWPINGSLQSYFMGMDDAVDVKLYPLTEEEAEEFRKITESALKTYRFDVKIMDMVVEEAESYFHGDKSLDEVCQIINNRVSTYVNENR